MSAIGLMVIPSISTIPEAYTAVDKFGVEMVYPIKTGGEQWLMKMDSPTSDSRFVPKTTLTKNTDGSWKVRSDAVRMNVFLHLQATIKTRLPHTTKNRWQQKGICNHQMAGRILR
jgi:hypothetical protein